MNIGGGGNRLSTHKIRKKYRLSFISDNTFNEIWSIKLSRTKVVISVIVLIFSIATIISTIIVGTPLKTLLPGYLKSDLRKGNVTNILRIDSLERNIIDNTLYLNNIKDILTDNISPDSLKSAQLLSEIPLDSLKVATDREKEFIKQFDEKEKFNLSILTPLAAEGIVFSTPVLGGVILPYPDNYSFNNGINIQTPKSAPVSAIYDGTVIDKYYGIESGLSIAIQHPNGFISKYTGLSAPFISKGDKVTAGQRIATVDESENKLNIFTFELWHEGLPVNPKEYITF